MSHVRTLTIEITRLMRYTIAPDGSVELYARDYDSLVSGHGHSQSWPSIEAHDRGFRTRIQVYSCGVVNEPSWIPLAHQAPDKMIEFPSLRDAYAWASSYARACGFEVFEMKLSPLRDGEVRE